MPQCCRCNGNGRCTGCVCARSMKTCTSCTPSRNGRCENQPVTGSAEAQPPPTQSNSPSRDSMILLAQQHTEALNAEASLPNNHSPGMEFAETLDQYEDPWPLPSCPTPDFQWGSLDGKTFCDSIHEASFTGSAMFFSCHPAPLANPSSWRLLDCYKPLQMGPHCSALHSKQALLCKPYSCRNPAKRVKPEITFLT